VGQNLQLALSKNASAEQRSRAIYLANNLRDVVTEASEKERLSVAIGDIYYLGNSHKKAVDTFAALAQENQGDKALTYWRRAIRSQNVLASWSPAPPWKGASQGSSEAREQLLAFYGKVNELAPDWNTWSHLGLLHMSQSRADDALKIWQDGLLKNQSPPHADFALGVILVSYQSSKQWASLEEWSRFGIKNQMSPMWRDKRINPRDTLALSLLEGGKQKYVEGKHVEAVAKLSEFVEQNPQHPRRDDGLHHLGLAQHGATQHRAAVETFISFTKQYPRSQFLRPTILLGSQWSSNMAWEDHVMYFNEMMISRFPKDGETKAMTAALSDLYLGREMYADAIRTLRFQIELAEPAEHEILVRRMLDAAQRGSSADVALKMANYVIAKYPGQTGTLAEAYAVKARALKANVSEMIKLETQVAGLGMGDASVVDTIAEIRFMIAEAFSNGVFSEDTFSLAERDPIGSLNQTYTKYNSIMKRYGSVCELPKNSWCAPAHHQSARLSERYLTSIETSRIANTLPDEDIAQFKARRSQIITAVTNAIATNDSKALQVAKGGGANPEWVRQVLWQSASDWNFEQLTGDGGRGYIQWSTAQ
jgi:tetratricopeptide (TPR) repeat protein